MHPRLFDRSLLLGLALFLLLPGAAFSYPALQLDIQGGAYDWSTETIVAQNDPFTLYAYLNSDKASLSNTYYISAALVPKTSPGTISGAGSFLFAGNPVGVTGDMVYGIPPLEANLSMDKGDLAKHGIFYTYFTEFSFTFDPANKATLYDTQAQPGIGPTPNPDGTMYFKEFLVDTRGLDPGYAIHFDLYSEIARCGSDLDINQFAPFSHDAQGPPKRVPEAGALLLFGSGLVGLVGYRRVRRMQ